jgi:hypothetical protein
MVALSPITLDRVIYHKPFAGAKVQMNAGSQELDETEVENCSTIRRHEFHEKEVKLVVEK